MLAIAQMGVHLVFFLHITSGPDNTNNVLALAFGVLIVFLVMIGTIWIMAHLDANMGADAGDDEPDDPARLEPQPGEPDRSPRGDDARRHRKRRRQALAARVNERDPDLHHHVGDDRPGDRHRGEQRRDGVGRQARQA